MNEVMSEVISDLNDQCSGVQRLCDNTNALFLKLQGQAHKLREEAAILLKEADQLEARAHKVKGALHLQEAYTILDIVSLELGVGVKDFAARNRTQHIVFVRQIAMYLIKQRCCFMSYPQIGALFNRDHSTVMHGVQQIEQRKMHYAALLRKLDIEVTKALKLNALDEMDFKEVG